MTLWHADDASLELATKPPVNANPGGGWGFSNAGKVSGGGAAVPLRKDQMEGYDPVAAAAAAAAAAAPPVLPQFRSLVLSGCEQLSVGAMRKALAARGRGLMHLDLSNGVRGVTELLKPASQRTKAVATSAVSRHHDHHSSGHHNSHHGSTHGHGSHHHHSSGHHDSHHGSTHGHGSHHHHSSGHHQNSHHSSSHGHSSHHQHSSGHHHSSHNKSHHHGSSHSHSEKNSATPVLGFSSGPENTRFEKETAEEKEAAEQHAREREEEARFSAALATLRFLNFSKCPALSATTIGLVALRCPCLLMLDLSFNGDSAVDDEGLRCLAAGARQLESLKIDRSKAITDEGLRSLVVKCQRLVALHASRCPSLNGTFLLAEPAPGGPSRVVVKCAKLHDLDLSFCESLDPFVLSWAASSAAKLRIVNVKGTPAVACGPALFALCACAKVIRFFAQWPFLLLLPSFAEMW